MSTARLFVLSGRQLGTDHLLEGPSVLGRGDDATVRLRDPSVSRAHARLSPEAEGWRLVDLGSSNGCFVGDERVETALLRDREEFRLGTLELRLRIEAAPASTGAAPDLAGRPVLRSQQDAARGGLLSSDLAQQSAPVRWLLYLLAIGLFVGLVWGSYRLVFGVRQARDVPAPEAYE